MGVGINYHGGSKDFKYNIGFNLSDVKNEVIDMRGINQTGITVSREGYAINSIYGYVAEGYFQSAEEVQKHAKQFGTVAPGDLKYKDINNDGIINESDKVILGSTIPRYTYGATVNLTWKNFDFNLLIQGVGQVNGLIYGAGITPFYTSDVGGSIQERFLDRWTPETPDAAFPRLVFGGSNNQQISSFWMKNAAYTRIKNLQLGYRLPAAFISRLHINSLKLFVNGSNLLTLDKFWKGYDVETAVGQASDYPIVKVFSFGLNVNF